MPLTVTVNLILKALQPVIEDVWASYCSAPSNSEIQRDWLRVYDSLRTARDRLTVIRGKQ